jgi:osmoprotectant transport system permease protein
MTLGVRELARAFATMACAAAVSASAQTVKVGSKEFTESFVLAEIAKGALVGAGVEPVHQQGLGGTIILWQALKGGSVDIYPEYTGTISEEILKQELTADQMRRELAKQGIGMTGELGFNNTYALVMRKERAQQLGISRISDLVRHPDLVAGPTLEFIGRKDGWRPLAARYGFKSAELKGIKHPLGYRALVSGEIDIKDAYSTDAAIAEHSLVVLEDDLGFFPQYKAVYLYRLSLPKGAIQALERLAGAINEAKMIELNALAEQSKDPVLAASRFLQAAEQPTNQVGEQPSIWRDLPRYTLEHLQLVAYSLFWAILVGLPLGIWASRPGILSGIILSGTGLLQTIPSLALFAILVPFMGTQPRTAILALFLYSLLPIVRSTAVGLATIAPSLKESAQALGLNPLARLRKVELPLASPTILSGIKTSAIINVGTAVIAAFIGAGGLGQPIQTGLALSDNERILMGGIAAAILALLVQFAFDLLDRVVIPRGLRLKAQ